MEHSEVVKVLISPAPFLACMVPVIGAILAAFWGKKEKIRNGIVIGTTLVTLAIVVSMYNPVYRGGIEYSLPTLLGWGLNFKVDLVGLLIAIVTAFVWCLSCIYATSYMAHEHARTRYYFFCLMTLAANLGILLTKDFFSLFLFFELMAIFSWVLVVHEEDENAMAAGRLYLYMCIIGGLCLLGGIILLYAFTGQMNIQPLGHLVNEIPGAIRYLIAIAMIIGFGMKAGIFFCHVWLPEAHPIAPTPASALLSGLMIKAGAYGILRTVNTLFAPIAEHGAEAAVHEAHASWTMLTTLGYSLIWVGVITMFFGVVNALMSPNCKRMLAYHSVSQMGYIVLGLGVGAYLGKEGAMGLAGGLYHMVNHALFKSALFLSIGAVYVRTRELDMYKLGGLWRNMPFICLTCFIAVMGISGVPFFNGFASKTILHHAINEAYELSGVYSASGQLDISLRLAEVFFMLTAFGTFCSNVKMWLFVFIWKRPEKYKDVKPAPASMKVALGTLSVAILFIGLRPNWMLEKFIGPALAYFGYESGTHAYHVLFNAHGLSGTLRSTIPLLYDPKTFSLLSSPEALHNVIGGGVAVLGGAMTFILGYRLGWFHAHPPEWLSVKYWYLKLAKGFIVAISVPGQAISDAVDEIYYSLASGFLAVPKYITSRRRRVSVAILEIVGGFAVKEEREWLAKLLEAEEECEAERVVFVRDAVMRSNVRLRKQGLSAEQRQEKIVRVRSDADGWARAIADKKVKILREAALEMRKAELPCAQRVERLNSIVKLADALKTISAKTAGAWKHSEEELERIARHSFETGEPTELTMIEMAEHNLESMSLKALDILEQAILAAGAKSKEVVAAEKMKTSAIIKETSTRMKKLGIVTTEINWEEILSRGHRRWQEAQKISQEVEDNLVNKFSNWFKYIMRISAEIVSEERVPWEVPKALRQEDIDKTRRSIRTYTRDLSYNILVAVVLIVLYVFALYGFFLH